MIFIGLLLIFWSTACIANRLMEIRDILRDILKGSDKE